MNKDKVERIAEAAKAYILEQIGGEEKIWEWMMCERHAWNGGGMTLKLQTWTDNDPPMLTLEVVYFLKSRWGIGNNRNGLSWSFKYTDTCIDSLQRNKTFKEAINLQVLQYIKPA